MENFIQGNLIVEVSKKIRQVRIDKRQTLQELADKSGVTKGLISQIENGRSIPSLPVMFNIIQSLEIEVSEFFKNLRISEPLVVVNRKEDYEVFEKENAKGFSYTRMLTRNVSSSVVDFTLLELQPGAERDEVQTDAFEYKYFLEGEADYLIDGKSYHLTKGDSLFFDGRLPHVPRNTSNTPCLMLIVYFFNQKG